MGLLVLSVPCPRIVPSGMQVWRRVRRITGKGSVPQHAFYSPALSTRLPAARGLQAVTPATFTLSPLVSYVAFSVPSVRNTCASTLVYTGLYCFCSVSPCPAGVSPLSGSCAFPSLSHRSFLLGALLALWFPNLCVTVLASGPQTPFWLPLSPALA